MPAGLDVSAAGGAGVPWLRGPSLLPCSAEPALLRIMRRNIQRRCVRGWRQQWQSAAGCADRLCKPVRQEGPACFDRAFGRLAQQRQATLDAARAVERAPATPTVRCFAAPVYARIRRAPGVCGQAGRLHCACTAALIAGIPRVRPSVRACPPCRCPLRRGRCSSMQVRLGLPFKVEQCCNQLVRITASIAYDIHKIRIQY